MSAPDLPRRRLLAAGALLPAVGSGLAADAPAPGGSPAAPITLRFAWWGGGERHKRTLAAIAAFEARHPGVRIKAEYMGINGYLEKLTMQMVGRTEPDIMQINWAWLAMFSKDGQGFLDLAPYRPVMALDQFSPQDLAISSVHGKLNGLPSSFSARIFLWNRAAWARAGLGLPDSWDALMAAGPQFRQRIGARAYALDGELYDMLLLAQTQIAQRHGTAYLHPTEPRVAMSPEALREWVQLYQQLTTTQVATPLRWRASLGGAEKPSEQQPDWVSGQWAGLYTWDSTVRLRQATLDAHQQLDIGPFLMLPQARASGIFGRPAMLLSASPRCRHPELAARFISFMLADAQAAQLLGQVRGVPAARSALAAITRDKPLPALEGKAWQQIQGFREAGRIEAPSPYFEDARFRKFLRDVFERVAYQKIDASEAARRLRVEGQALLNRIG